MKASATAPREAGTDTGISIVSGAVVGADVSSEDERAAPFSGDDVPHGGGAGGVRRHAVECEPTASLSDPGAIDINGDSGRAVADAHGVVLEMASAIRDGGIQSGDAIPHLGASEGGGAAGGGVALSGSDADDGGDSNSSAGNGASAAGTSTAAALASSPRFTVASALAAQSPDGGARHGTSDDAPLLTARSAYGASSLHG